MEDPTTMKILKLQIEGVPLFKDELLELDFFAQDRVPSSNNGSLAPNDVFKLNNQDSNYVQNIIGISGVNATGKTTVLNLIGTTLALFNQEATARGFGKRALFRLGKLNDEIIIRVIFWHDGHYYLIESDLDHSLVVNDDDERVSSDAFAFTDETLWIFDNNKKMSREKIKSFDSFKEESHILLRRNGPENDDTVLPKMSRSYLDDGLSIVFPLVRKDGTIVETRQQKLPEKTLSTPIVQAFDNSIEYLEWDGDSSVYHLKFHNEPEKTVNSDVAHAILSRGTIAGSELVSRAANVLRKGGCMIIDEIEEALNRSLVSTVLDLFASPVTNPHGAQLIFSTHYPQLLDNIHRKDNVYILIRNEEFKTEVIKYSDRAKRIENKKSEIIMSNLIKGSTPRYPDVQAMRDYVRVFVNE